MSLSKFHFHAIGRHREKKQKQKNTHASTVDLTVKCARAVNQHLNRSCDNLVCPQWKQAHWAHNTINFGVTFKVSHSFFFQHYAGFQGFPNCQFQLLPPPIETKQERRLWAGRKKMKQHIYGLNRTPRITSG